MTDSKLFDELYSGLNDAQRTAVDTIEGPVVVNAGPGTGKTQILTLRIANILRQQGGDMAENILALTFTNAGVVAMRKRLSSIIGSDAYRVGIFTFHSFAEQVIKSNPDVFTDHLSTNLITDVERLEMVEKIIASGEYKILKPFAAPDFFVQPILAAIDELKRDAFSPDQLAQWNENLKQQLLDSEDSYYKRNGAGFKKGDLKKDALKKYDKNLELIEIYKKYEESLVNKKLYDYNDLIITVISKLETDSDFQYNLQEQYQYILLDEQQDSNAGQNRIVELLTDAEHLEGRPNLFTVGDDKQAIYRFQGASLENFLSFENKYQDVVTVNLDQNYRSGQDVLDTAHNLIMQDDSERKHQQLQSNKKTSKVECHEFNTYADELDFVAQNIKQQLDDRVEQNDIAVLYRENRHTDDIQKALARYGIPSVVMARENILETPLVYKILLLMRSVSDLTNNHNLTQLLYSDVFGTNTYDVLRIVERHRRNKRDKNTGTKHLFRVIQDKKILNDISVEDTDVYLSISQTLQLGHTTFASTNFLSAFDELMKSSGLIHKIIDDESSHDQLRYYDRFYEELRALVNSNLSVDLEQVIGHFETYRQYGMSLDSNPSDSVRGVRLLTAHKSKGLEYEQVYITNLVDKVWGNKINRRQFELPTGNVRGDNDDERRLLYVGITRAEENCTLSFSRNNGERDTDPSQFLYDLDQTILDWVKHDESVAASVKHSLTDQSINNQTLFDDELIQTTYKKRPLSVTALNNYFDCPAKYFVNNLLQIPATYSRSLIYGSLMHRALELFFRKSAEAGQILSLDELQNMFLWAIDQEYLGESEKKDIIAKGTDSLNGYHKQYHSVWNHNVENEMRINGVELALNNTTVTLTGVLDKVEHDESGTNLRVVDYKTGKTFSEKTKDQKEALERQIVFYSLLLDLYRDGHFTMTSGVLDFVEPNKKTGEYEQHEIKPTSEERDILVEKIQKMDDEICQGTSFLNNRCDKFDCDSCWLLKNVMC